MYLSPRIVIFLYFSFVSHSDSHIIGDVCDKGIGSIRITRQLVALKKKYHLTPRNAIHSTKKRYGERVILILGNRDINKMRWTSELEDAELHANNLDAVPGPYWVKQGSQ